MGKEAKFLNGEKFCPRCKTFKAPEQYARSSYTSHGLQTYCRACCSLFDKEKVARRKVNGPTITRDSKVCAKCKNEKPISQFGKRTSSADGKMPYCKPCWLQITKLAQKRRNVIQ